MPANRQINTYISFYYISNYETISATLLRTDFFLDFESRKSSIVRTNGIYCAGEPLFEAT